MQQTVLWTGGTMAALLWTHLAGILGTHLGGMCCTDQGRTTLGMRFPCFGPFFGPTVEDQPPLPSPNVS